jgi:hypothetical protein
MGCCIPRAGRIQDSDFGFLPMVKRFFKAPPMARPKLFPLLDTNY